MNNFLRWRPNEFNVDLIQVDLITYYVYWYFQN